MNTNGQTIERAIETLYNYRNKHYSDYPSEEPYELSIAIDSILFFIAHLVTKNVIVYFAKTKPDAIIPSKRNADAGYDIYPCINKDIVIQPHTTVLIPSGIASSFSSDYFFFLTERGSSGSRGIAQRCGVIDSNYRGEWSIPVTNTNNFPIVIPCEKNCKWLAYDNENYKRTGNYYMVFPFKRAIAQAVLLPVPKTKIVEIPYDQLKTFHSDRGLGCFGSSGK